VPPAFGILIRIPLLSTLCANRHAFAVGGRAMGRTCAADVKVPAAGHVVGFGELAGGKQSPAGFDKIKSG
jgi:hypothetical protein